MRYRFDSTARIVQTETQKVDFGGRRIVTDQDQLPILQAALTGFDIHFDNGDHPVARLEIALIDVRIVPDTRDTEAQATVRFLIRDASGNIDDPFSGVVDVLFLAEVV
jgi:hypothetical protein